MMWLSGRVLNGAGAVNPYLLGVGQAEEIEASRLEVEDVVALEVARIQFIVEDEGPVGRSTPGEAGVPHQGSKREATEMEITIIMRSIILVCIENARMTELQAVTVTGAVPTCHPRKEVVVGAVEEEQEP